MANLRKVAYYTYTPYPVAFEQMRVLSPLKELKVEILDGVKDGVVSLEPIQEADLIILQRNFPGGFNQSMAVIDEAHKLGKAVLMDIDDDLLGLDLDHPDLVNTVFAFELIPTLYALRAVDAVTVTTSNLQKTISQHNDHVYVLPNYLDDQVWQMKPSRDKTDESPVKLLYFGTQSHLLDIEMIGEALKQLARQYPGKLEYVFYGTKPPIGLKSLAKVNFFPAETHNYRGFVKIIQNFEADIAIAPLRDTTFNRSKSPLKYFEYTALGLPAVYSDIPPYSGVVENDKTGLMAKTNEDWLRKLSSLVENSCLRKSILNYAREDVKTKHLMSKNLDSWTKIYEEVIDRGVVEAVNRTIELPLLARLSHHVGNAANYQANQLALYKEETEKLTTELDETRKILNLSLVEYASSTSWKITRPLRKLMKKFRES